MMKILKRTINCFAVSVMAALWLLCMTAAADSGDNSLYDLGLENAKSISPEFYYSTLEYNVTVEPGTTELMLNPVTSDPNAFITDISGTTLDENGSGTVYITVEAPNGSRVSYTLNVSADGAAAGGETEAQTKKDDEQAYMDELQRQSESEEALRRQAELESSQRAVETLTTQNKDLTNRINLLMKVLYGLVGFAVLLLIFIINQSLRNKDLKDDLKEARGQAEMNNEFARKEQNMQNGYYYNMPQNMQQGMPAGGNGAPGGMGQPMAEATQNVQAAFGNAPQMLRAQAAPGQVNAPAQPTAPAQAAAPQPTAQAKPAAPAEPTLVQSQVQEPDVNVEMIDL